MALRIPQAKLSTIKATPGNNPEGCLKATLIEFLKKNYNTEMYGEPSWRLIVIAVAKRAGGDNVDLALKIAQNHPTTSRSSLQGEWVLLKCELSVKHSQTMQ